MQQSSHGRDVTGHGMDVRWRKASYCSAMTSCVELAALAGNSVAIRNSRHPDGPVLIYDQLAIRELIAGIKDGEFDDLAV